MSTQQAARIPKVPVTGGLLAFATVTTIVSQLFVGLSLVLLASFFRDEPLFGRNTPNLHTPKNSLVSLCSNGSLTKPLCTGRTPSLFLYSSYNILALGIFWLQHIVLAKTNVKRRLIARFPQYLAAERSLFNLSAALTLILSLYLYSPSRRDALFSLPEGFRPLFDLIQIAAGVLFIKGLLETDVHRDLFGVRSLRKLYRTDSLDYHELYEQRDTLEQQLCMTGLYDYCRHPAQSGILLFMLFSGLHYTPDRIVLLAIMFVGANVGAQLQEDRLMALSENYRQYVQKVPNRFIPSLSWGVDKTAVRTGL